MSSHGHVHGSKVDQANDQHGPDVDEDRLEAVVRTMRRHQRIATAAAGLSLACGALALIQEVS